MGYGRYEVGGSSMADFRSWIRELFSQPRTVPARSLSAPPATTPPVRSSSRVSDLDADAVAANPSESPADILAASVDDHNAFAAALYGELRANRGNLFFAPFSVRAALAMTYAGARSDTAAEMHRALQISVSDQALHASCASMVVSFDAGSDAAHEMAVANALWS